VHPLLPDNKRESQTTEITQPISGQPLRSPHSGRLEGRTAANPSLTSVTLHCLRSGGRGIICGKAV
jgi:hypothetical protein